MRAAFDTVAIEGTVVIGEGEMDEAPMLYIGEKVGSGGPKMDIAVDRLRAQIYVQGYAECDDEVASPLKTASFYMRLTFTCRSLSSDLVYLMI